jgi:hypothetical protein
VTSTRSWNPPGNVVVPVVGLDAATPRQMHHEIVEDEQVQGQQREAHLEEVSVLLASYQRRTAWGVQGGGRRLQTARQAGDHH